MWNPTAPSERCTPFDMPSVWVGSTPLCSIMAFAVPKKWVKIATSLLKLINPQDQVIKPVFCVEMYSYVQWVCSTKIRTLYIYIQVGVSNLKETWKETTKKGRTKCEVLVTSIHRLLYWEHSNHCSRFLSHWRNASWKTETTWNNASGMLVNIP